MVKTVPNRDRRLYILLLCHDNVTIDCLIDMLLLTKKSNQGDLSDIKNNHP